MPARTATVRRRSCLLGQISVSAPAARAMLARGPATAPAPAPWRSVRCAGRLGAFASAPAGSDSNCMLVVEGADFDRTSNCIQLGMLEHAARLKPQAAIAMTRFMTDTVHSLGPTAVYKTHSSAIGGRTVSPRHASPT